MSAAIAVAPDIVADADVARLSMSAAMDVANASIMAAAMDLDVVRQSMTAATDAYVEMKDNATDVETDVDDYLNQAELKRAKYSHDVKASDNRHRYRARFANVVQVRSYLVVPEPGDVVPDQWKPIIRRIAFSDEFYRRQDAGETAQVDE